nr:ribonuclease H-like domain-containing protein [Tanacetum cinerariifolium]
MGFDMSKVECYNCHRKGHFTSECRSPKDTRRTAAEPQRRTTQVENSTSNALVSQCDAEEEPANFALMAITSSSSSSDNESDYESLSPRSLSDRIQPSGGYHAVPPPITGTFMPSKPDLVFHTSPIAVKTDHLAFTVQLSTAKPAQDLSHTTRPLAPIIEDRPVEAHILTATPKPTSPKTNKSGKKKNRKTCFVCRSVDHLIKDCNFHAKPKPQPTSKNYAHKGYNKQNASFTQKHPQKHIVPAAVLTKSKPVSVTAIRPVSAVVPKIMMTRPKHAHSIDTKSKLTFRRHITRSKSPKTSNSPPRVTAAQALVVSATKGNMSYLSDFQKLNGGYVAFGGNPKGGKISGKGKIKTVIFTDNECLVLSPDFKISDESQVLLRVPRENNMYNVNLKDIVPSGDLTCLFAKATIDESNLWHRRLGHINFKTINKLVKGNLVRGLPIKVLEIIIPVLLVRKASNIEPLGIKREFSVPRTPQQNGIAKRKNRTLIEVARTMLADSLLPIPFWAEAVNTTCYVQNRVLVTKPHNKTPYELLFCRTPSIGFMRPFGCPVTIINTLEPLGKFEENVDEGFLVGYSVNSKAFRVFNSRTRIVQETLHVNFLKNKPNIAGTGPTWLFEIDSLTRTMNYQPVTGGNQSNPSAGFQEIFDAENAGEEANQQYMLFPVWSTGSSNPQNKEGDAAFDGEQDDKTKKRAKGKSPVESFMGNRDLNADFEDYLEDNSNDFNAAGPIIPNAGQNYSNSTNPFSADGPSNTNTSPTHGKSSLKDAFQLPNNSDMLEIEDIAHSDHEDVGAEADFNNLETSITVSPIPTTRTHKAHTVSQIISDLYSTTQTRSMTRVIKDQVRLLQIFNDDFHTCMFACFLSQEDPKRVHQALKDPSWIEAMQEELLQFKMHKVWILVDLPHGKKAIGTKWVYRNKKDDRGIVVRNKARLVAQGHTQ